MGNQYCIEGLLQILRMLQDIFLFVMDMMKTIFSISIGVGKALMMGIMLLEP